MADIQERIARRMQPRPEHVERQHIPNIIKQNLSDEELAEIIQHADEREEEIRDNTEFVEWDEEWKRSSAEVALMREEEHREEQLLLAMEGRAQRAGEDSL